MHLLQIRHLTAADAVPLWELRLVALTQETRAFGSSAEEHARTTAEEYWEGLNTRSPGTFVLGAFEDARLVGMIRLTRERTQKRRHLAWVESLFVRSGSRGTGVGRTLVTRVLEEARAMPGLVCLFLTVAAGQTTARKLYIDAGFRSSGVEPRGLKVDGGYIDEEFLVLDLVM